MGVAMVAMVSEPPYGATLALACRRAEWRGGDATIAQPAPRTVRYSSMSCSYGAHVTSAASPPAATATRRSR